ncbi:MAG: SH3 domain-containing protein [Ruminococcus sp.]|nr:SH3 domain-containing protein [Ruminococcus sp.]
MSKRYYNNSNYTDHSTEEVKVEEAAVEEQVEKTKTEEVIEEPTKIEPAPTPDTKVKTVKAKSLIVREKPDQKSKILRVLLSGEKVTVLETVNSWYKVEAQDGKVRGYCMSTYIE